MTILTQARLKEVLSYNPRTGVWRWPETATHMMAGRLAGCTGPYGYRYIGVDGERYFAHRLAFLYMTGSWPTHMVDHKNRVRSDNRWSNLRNVTNAENQQNQCGPQRNNKSGYLGVCWNKAKMKWVATIRTHGLIEHLGAFYDIREARDAYVEAKKTKHAIQ